ncbi:hypothetical protein ABZY44_03905 [Streptomyces sp. NPDC006544]|uniref:hypothetical protein n=1 Tax=Streptomyces sp. NPDC006544 TaxID=3154583 RepID=UPI0033B540E1
MRCGPGEWNGTGLDYSYEIFTRHASLQFTAAVRPRRRGTGRRAWHFRQEGCGMIRRHVTWRNEHTARTRLRTPVTRINVA